MRTVRRLRLRFFSFNIYSDVPSTLLLVALSKLCRPIIKKLTQILMLKLLYTSLGHLFELLHHCQRCE